MNIDTAAALSFLASHGRILDRRRLDLQLGHGDAEAVLVSLDAYRNDDGGYGWGIEPDLRSQESQPVGAMHALEVLAEIAPVASSATARMVELCDWLDQKTLDDGGLPLTLPITDPAGCAPLWLGSDHETSSLQMTAQVAANAHLVARQLGRVVNRSRSVCRRHALVTAGMEGLGCARGVTYNPGSGSSVGNRQSSPCACRRKAA